MKTTSNEGVTLPGDIQSGDHWSQTLGVEVSADNLTMDFTIENSFKAAGYEVVSVPAGTFDALKVEMESTTNGGNPITQTLWYVQDVGLVKSVPSISVLPWSRSWSPTAFPANKKIRKVNLEYS